MRVKIDDRDVGFVVVAGSQHHNRVDRQVGAIVVGVGHLLQQRDTVVMQKSVIMVRKALVLDIDHDPIFQVLGKEVKLHINVADGRRKGLFRLDFIDLDLRANRIRHKRHEDCRHAEGFFEDHAVAQRCHCLHKRFAPGKSALVAVTICARLYPKSDQSTVRVELQI